MSPTRSPSHEAQLFGLSTLIQLAKRARHAESLDELGFVIVNETHALVRYRQAAFWRREHRSAGRIQAISGTPVVERNAPFVLWLRPLLAQLARAEGGDAVRRVEPGELSARLAGEWAEWFPAHGLLVALRVGAGRELGAILFVREQPWSDGERHLLQELADAYAYALAAFERRLRRGIAFRLRRRRSIIGLVAAVAAAGALFLPVWLSALAPADIVPYKPTIVRAPLDGVVDHFDVQPNDPVEIGQALVDLDPRAIQNKLAVAQQALVVAEAEYRQAAQQAVYDDKSRAQLATLKGRMDQRRADATYTQSLLDRIHVTATRSGIALLTDPNDWIGRPVAIGEKLLDIADPAQPELEIWLPVADAITLAPGAEVEFFQNVAPTAPLRAVLRQTSYEATLSPSGVLAYRLKAALVVSDHPPRIGLRGTAKIYGDRVPLYYYLLRRPLAVLRQFFGL